MTYRDLIQMSPAEVDLIVQAQKEFRDLEMKTFESVREKAMREGRKK